MSERLPISVLPDDVQTTRENIRRHHWRRFWQCVRAEDLDGMFYHRELAESVQKNTLEKGIDYLNNPSALEA